eukprot:TRINITY_DN14940_c0_g1_i2.p1 TRINITY_DN14940_c0_g1~~TRINITY_DN14940_c0_g1_i2.p1  ORF type:complete len:161 (+),score=38.68 TRINITY_DN14940_c0_g1_i2:23-484(+)
MIRRPPRSTHCISSAASDVYKRQVHGNVRFQANAGLKAYCSSAKGKGVYKSASAFCPSPSKSSMELMVEKSNLQSRQYEEELNAKKGLIQAKDREIAFFKSQLKELSREKGSVSEFSLLLKEQMQENHKEHGRIYRRNAQLQNAFDPPTFNVR